MHFPEEEKDRHRCCPPRFPLSSPHLHVGQARVQHSQGAVFADGGQQGSARRGRGREARGSQDKPRWASSRPPLQSDRRRGPNPHGGLRSGYHSSRQFQGKMREMEKIQGGQSSWQLTTHLVPLCSPSNYPETQDSQPRCPRSPRNSLCWVLSWMSAICRQGLHSPKKDPS